MLKSHIAGQPHSTRQSRPRAAISLRTAAQRRSRSCNDGVGYSTSLRMACPHWVVSGAKLLQGFQIVRDPALEVVFRLVAQLRARAADVVDAGRRIGETVEVQTRSNVHHRV